MINEYLPAALTFTLIVLVYAVVIAWVQTFDLRKTKAKLDTVARNYRKLQWRHDCTKADLEEATERLAMWKERHKRICDVVQGVADPE